MWFQHDVFSSLQGCYWSTWHVCGPPAVWRTARHGNSVRRTEGQQHLPNVTQPSRESAKATKATELFQALALNTTLTELSLFDNNISDAGATELSKALVVNNALAKLDLAQNQIGDTGAAELSKALTVNTVLTMLNLYNKNIGDVGTLALGNQCVKQIFEMRCQH